MVLMEEETKQIVAKRRLELTEEGGFALRSLEDQMKFAEDLIKYQMISNTFKTPQQVVVGFQYAKALKVNELLALRMMYVVNGKPSLFGEGPLSLCQRTGLVVSLKELYLNENGDEISVQNKNLKDKVYASVTRVGRRGDLEIQEDYFTLDDLETAGLRMDNFGKVKAIWVKWERIMMRYKARTMALRSKFADMLAGIPVAEYDDNFSPEMPEVKEPKNTIATDLEKAYAPQDESQKSSVITVDPI
jgi:hypothetical protein